MAQIERRRRAEIQREATRIRETGQREGWTVDQTASRLRSALPEVTELEARRLAHGWSRPAVVRAVAELYRADGLRPPGLNSAMLCRWEHGAAHPGSEYGAMLARVYNTDPARLQMGTQCPCGRECPARPIHGWYGHGLVPAGTPRGAHPMTTPASLSAVRESLALALADSAPTSLTVVDLVEAAVEHYAANYSKHPPAILLEEIHRVRGMLALPPGPSADGENSADLRRATGWLTALMGNLAFHLGDNGGARAHLAAAVGRGHASGDNHLIAWSLGATAMVARFRHRYPDALDLADQALVAAPTPLVRAQILAWARLPALAGLGRVDDVSTSLAEAARQLEADPDGESPGRFGFDVAEFELHAAEARLALGQHAHAARHAAASAQACRTGSPGWAAATVVLAHTDSRQNPADAAQQAHAVLDIIPADRLRATTRGRLAALDRALRPVDQGDVRSLHERLRSLPPAVDNQNRPG